MSTSAMQQRLARIKAELELRGFRVRRQPDGTRLVTLGHHVAALTTPADLERFARRAGVDVDRVCG